MQVGQYEILSQLACRKVANGGEVDQISPPLQLLAAPRLRPEQRHLKEAGDELFLRPKSPNDSMATNAGWS